MMGYSPGYSSDKRPMNHLQEEDEEEKKRIEIGRAGRRWIYTFIPAEKLHFRTAADSLASVSLHRACMTA